MKLTLFSLAVCTLAFLFYSPRGFAWFIWIPTGAIAKALEKDPDSIAVSLGDRSIGKCAGYHVNQYKKFAPPLPFGDEPLSQQNLNAEALFHREIADLAIARASDKQKVIDLAEAYSTRWSRVAGADLNANRAYGADLAQGCIANRLPYRQADYAAWKARQEDERRAQDEEAQRQAEARRKQLDDERTKAAEAKQRAKDEADARRAAPTVAASSPSSPSIDFAAEARKSARILGCIARDLRVAGAEGSNVLFTVSCESGEALNLTCEPTGTCLRR